VRELESYGAHVHVHDPVAQAGEAEHEYGVRLVGWDALPRAAAIVGAVAHREFKARPVDAFVAKLVPGGLFVDVKSQMDAGALTARGVRVWRL
jgi:UDP-N-acetyl-D-galactosamine dehydrogenase